MIEKKKKKNYELNGMEGLGKLEDKKKDKECSNKSFDDTHFVLQVLR